MVEKRKLRPWVATIFILVVLIFFWWQNNVLEVSYYTYCSEDLPQAFEGYRIVQISDLHNATFGQGNEKLLAKVRDLNPDMVVITGDIVDSNHTNIEVALDFAEQVATYCPTYFVTGNHENWLEAGDKLALMNGLQEAGVVCLADEAVEIWQGEECITLIGLNDESLSGSVLQRVMGAEKAGQIYILLAHEPQYLENYSKYSVDLVLTGHAHGGQFRMPFVGGGLVAPDQGFFPKYTEGVHVMDETTMIISRGLGNSIIPVRLFNQPEIVCVELQLR